MLVSPYEIYSVSGDCIPGMYAITMVGMLPPGMLEACEEQGFKARCTKSKPAASQN